MFHVSAWAPPTLLRVGGGAAARRHRDTGHCALNLVQASPPTLKLLKLWTGPRDENFVQNIVHILNNINRREIICKYFVILTLGSVSVL
jgi:hypothetical protein